MAAIQPDYTGGSLVNLVGTLARRFGVDTGHPGLAAAPDLADGTDRVVLCICDALGALQLDGHLAAGTMPWLQRRLAEGDARLMRLTSVFPTTTAAALSSLHTGWTPAEHGYLGYSLWLGDGPEVTDMLLSRDRATQEPRTPPAVPPSLYTRLPMRCRAVNSAAFAHSALTRWHFAGAEYRRWYSPNTLPSLIADAVDGAQLAYVTAYWPDHDPVCHVHGPVGPEAADEVAALDLVLSRIIARLPRSGRTLLLLVGDHGQRQLDPAAAVHLAETAAGERTATYLRDAPGLVERLSPYADLRRTDDLWREGWFGGPPADAAFRRRVGDWIAIPRDGRQFLWSPTQDRYRGGHGGWSAEEMLVPLVCIRI